MNPNIQSTTTLHNGVKMPWFGLGVFQTRPGREVIEAVRLALQVGYRSIDTASMYGNEAGVGQAIKTSGLPRQEIFVTTKVWNDEQGYDATLKAFDASLERLGLEYVDLYLVHWPVRGKLDGTWRALESIYRGGRSRAIGVSNFLEHHLEDLLVIAEIAPMVDQVEFHPRLQQPDLQAYCKQQDIQLEAWAPLMKGRVMDIPELVRLGDKYGKTPVQVTLRWMLQLGVITIPKSARQERIQENADIFDFELTDEDMALINALDRDQRIGWHPDRHYP